MKLWVVSEHVGAITIPGKCVGVCTYQVKPDDDVMMISRRHVENHLLPS